MQLCVCVQKGFIAVKICSLSGLLSCQLQLWENLADLCEEIKTFQMANGIVLKNRKSLEYFLPVKVNIRGRICLKSFLKSFENETAVIGVVTCCSI